MHRTMSTFQYVIVLSQCIQVNTVWFKWNLFCSQPEYILLSLVVPIPRTACHNTENGESWQLQLENSVLRTDVQQRHIRRYFTNLHYI